MKTYFAQLLSIYQRRMAWHHVLPVSKALHGNSGVITHFSNGRY